MNALPPDDWRARLAHHLTALAARTLRARYDGAVPGELIEEPETMQVRVPAGTVHALSWGEGAPTVLLHGLNANARYWTGVACLLARRRRVLAPDLRGHGGTGRLAGGFTLEETRADLEAWLDGLGLEQIDLVGHSWGGRVALDLAAARPRCVRRLALVDPVPPEGLPPVARWLPGLPRAVFAPERGPFVGPEQLARAHRTVSWLRHAEPWMHAAFDASFVRDPDDGARPVLDDEGFGAIYRGLLAPAALDAGRLRDVPVLLALASFSVMGFPGMVRALRRRLPHLRLVRVAGEHSLHATNPVGLARALAAFLDGPRCLIPERPAGTRGPGPDPQGASRDG